MCASEDGDAAGKFNMGETMKTILRSEDLTCPSCIVKIEKALGGLNGVDRAEVKFNSGKIEIEHDPARTSTAQLVEAVRAVGYESRVSPF